jgi:hypothetical protein
VAQNGLARASGLRSPRGFRPTFAHKLTSSARRVIQPPNRYGFKSMGEGHLKKTLAHEWNPPEEVPIRIEIHDEKGAS